MSLEQRIKAYGEQARAELINRYARTKEKAKQGKAEWISYDNKGNGLVRQDGKVKVVKVIGSISLPVGSSVMIDENNTIEIRKAKPPRSKPAITPARKGPGGYKSKSRPLIITDDGGEGFLRPIWYFVGRFSNFIEIFWEGQLLQFSTIGALEETTGVPVENQFISFPVLTFVDGNLLHMTCRFIAVQSASSFVFCNLVQRQDQEGYFYGYITFTFNTISGELYFKGANNYNVIYTKDNANQCQQIAQGFTADGGRRAAHQSLPENHPFYACGQEIFKKLGNYSNTGLGVGDVGYPFALTEVYPPYGVGEFKNEFLSVSLDSGRRIAARYSPYALTNLFNQYPLDNGVFEIIDATKFTNNSPVFALIAGRPPEISLFNINSSTSYYEEASNGDAFDLQDLSVQQADYIKGLTPKISDPTRIYPIIGSGNYLTQNYTGFTAEDVLIQYNIIPSILRRQSPFEAYVANSSTNLARIGLAFILNGDNAPQELASPA